MKKITGYGLILLFVLSVAVFLCSRTLRAEFYKYIDRNGVLRFVDDPSKIPLEYRDDMQSYAERYDHLTEQEKALRLERERQDAERVRREQMDLQPRFPPEKPPDKPDAPLRKEGGDDAIETPVTVKGGNVYVPTLLGYDGREVEALLILDTGATIMALHQELADRLQARPTRAARAQVAGGKTVPFKLFRLDYVQVGPHRMENVQAGIIQHRGPDVAFQGLLGMNFLINREYSVDYKKGVIKWHP